jgi:hypothetical protein
MAAGYSQGLCFIPGAKVGPVPINANFFYKTILQALLDKGEGGGRGGGNNHVTYMNTINRLMRLRGRF